jgi:hypothetical protein
MPIRVSRCRSLPIPVSDPDREYLEQKVCCFFHTRSIQNISSGEDTLKLSHVKRGSTQLPTQVFVDQSFYNKNMINFSASRTYHGGHSECGYHSPTRLFKLQKRLSPPWPHHQSYLTLQFNGRKASLQKQLRRSYACENPSRKIKTNNAWFLSWKFQEKRSLNTFMAWIHHWEAASVWQQR